MTKRMIKNYMTLQWILLSIFIVSVIGIHFSLSYYFNNEKKITLNNITKQYLQAYGTVYNAYEDISLIYYSGIKNRVKLDEKLFEVLNSNDTTLHAKIRQSIYENMATRYKQLQEKYILSINIILPDDTIFFKMKNPAQFGQTLSSYRDLPRYVNQEKKPFSSFESGKYGSGYRFSYPIMYKNLYVGQLCFTFDATAITSTIMRDYNVLCNFLTVERYLDKKYIEKSKKYIPSHYEGYLFNISVLKELEEKTDINIKSLITHEEIFNESTKKFREKTVHTSYDDRNNIVITTIPVVHKITNETQAILSIRSVSKALEMINNSYMVVYFISMISITSIFILLYIIIKNLINRVNYEEIEKEKLEKQKQKYSTLLENSSDSIQVLDKEGKLLEYSKQTQESLGYSDKEMKKLYVYDWDKELEESTYKEYFSCSIEDKPLVVERIHTRKDESQYIASITISKVTIDGEEYLYAASRDITLQKELEREILEAQTKFFKLFNDSLDPILLLDLESKNFTDVNNAAIELYGYTKEEFLKLTPNDLDMVFDENDIQKLIQKVLDKGWDKQETKHQLKDKRVIDVFLSAVIVELSNATYLYISVKDITKEKMYKEKLKLQKEEFEAIFNFAEDGILITNLQGNFLKFNKAFRDLTGFSEKELLEKDYLDLSKEEDKEKNTHILQQVIESGHVGNFEKECIVKDNKRVPVHVSISALPDNKNLLFIVKDASNIKLLQEQSKLASMGELIGNIAHQWRQPLSIITTNASGLKMKLDFGGEISKEEMIQCSDSVVEQSQYLSKVIDSFRNFLKKEKGYSKIAIDQVFSNTFNLIESTIKNNYIEFVTDIEKDLYIIGSMNELCEVFINIINNSKDILTENVPEYSDRLIFINAKAVDNIIEIIVKDSGGGIPENIIENIFEPYFTTKHQSIGTGLGLSMVEKIIRQRHEGMVLAYNEEFEYKNKKYTGACFKIVFKNNE